MRVFVTGASGQLGSFLLDQLVDRHDVLGVDLVSPRFEAHRDLVERADITNRVEMERLVAGSDVVVHCAAQISVDWSNLNPLGDMDANLGGTASVLEAARKAKARRFIFISSAATYGDPIAIPVREDHPQNPLSFYGTSKVCSEQYVREYSRMFGMEHAIVRPFNFYSDRADPSSSYSGVMTKFVGWAKQGEPLVIEGDGGQTRDFIHASDVARMVVRLVESDATNMTFNCGSGKETSILKLAETVVKVSGGKSPIRHVEARRGDIRRSVADVNLARDKICFEARVGLETGIATFFS
ncbi:MAG: NAD-dependent epimerase/dehydratase family protein [Methanomassiliicoccales archaeon]|nr:NAD-dependent epimerase/dehydratase family protein [Methanomassiliicoccales archaeon]